MRNHLRIAAALVCFQALPSSAQGGMDMAVAEKWAKAKVVRYRVEGLHTGRAPVILGDYEGKADIIDRVTVEFTWDVRKGKVIGPVTVVDGKSQLRNLKSDGTNCGPPQLKGDYEHFQSVSTTMMGDLIQINGKRTYPAASVSNYPASCSMRAIRGGSEDVRLHLGGAEPQALGMPIVQGGALTVAADRKSFSMKGAENWVWTYTPALVQ